jgi:hypothetical protein
MKKLFEFDSEHTINQFVSIDDRVMGGVSRSAVIRCTPKSACFKGVVVPDNGGGFASVRSTAISLTNNDAVGFELDYSGDGKVYKFRVLSSRVEDSIVYQASFSTISGVRQQVKF